MSRIRGSSCGGGLQLGLGYNISGKGREGVLTIFVGGDPEVARGGVVVGVAVGAVAAVCAGEAAGGGFGAAGWCEAPFGGGVNKFAEEDEVLFFEVVEILEVVDWREGWWFRGNGLLVAVIWERRLWHSRIEFEVAGTLDIYKIGK